MHDIIRTRRFSMLLDDMSEVFSMSSCSYNNAKYKKNCARLGIYKAFELVDSYTIEASCFGYEQKSSLRSKYIEDQTIVQFTVDHLLKFGETLALAASKQLGRTELELNFKKEGLDIIPTFGLNLMHKP